MVVVDPVFMSAGKKEGIEVWRIKNFKLELVDPKEHGVFFGGDSYILLHSSGVKCFSYKVHMWLGEDTTTDEAGTAAIKMVELDDSLGGGPVQYREVQYHESSHFLGYFKKGIRYLKGGYDSGFKQTKQDLQPRLFHIKGRHVVRVQQVDLTRDSLNLGDAFILDTGKTLYVWLPPECNRLERMKATEQARNIRDVERSGRATLEILDSDWDTNTEFWEYFGGADGKEISPSAAGGDDVDFMEMQKTALQLWRVSDESGKLNIEKIAENVLEPQMLDSADAFILDAGFSGIFVWIGKGCTANEKKNAMKWATWFQNTPILNRSDAPVAYSSSKTAPKVNFKTSVFETRLFHCSDASGKLKVEEIANFTQEDLNSDDVMVLDCEHGVFVWNGLGANTEEKESGQMIAKKYLDISSVPRAQTATIITIEQGKEHDNFTAKFPEWSPHFWNSKPDIPKKPLF